MPLTHPLPLLEETLRKALVIPAQAGIHMRGNDPSLSLRHVRLGVGQGIADGLPSRPAVVVVELLGLLRGHRRSLVVHVVLVTEGLYHRGCALAVS